MSIETLRQDDRLTYKIDEYGNRIRRTAQEQAIITLEENFKDFLDHSNLSADDLQRLRRLSADYGVISAPYPEDDKEIRRTILDNLSSDIPEANEIDSVGLRRLSSRLHGPTIVVDGCPIPADDLELVYTLIEPSKEVLDRAMHDASYFYVADQSDAQEGVSGAVSLDQSADILADNPERIAVGASRSERKLPVSRIRRLGTAVFSLFG